MTDRWTAAGLLAALVGAAAVVRPAALTAAYGLPPATGPSALAWRLFGVRTLAVGVGVLRGEPAARAVVLPVQLLDQAVFVHALARGSVPRRAGALAMATSAVLVGLSWPRGEGVGARPGGRG